MATFSIGDRYRATMTTTTAMTLESINAAAQAQGNFSTSPVGPRLMSRPVFDANPRITMSKGYIHDAKATSRRSRYGLDFDMDVAMPV